MGKWNIEIAGHGMHHNDKAEDADKMAAEFVKTLKEAGHDVEGATLTLDGGTVTNLDPK